MRRPTWLRPAVIGLFLLTACGPGPSPAERVLLERQKFEVRLLSWAPFADGHLTIDLEVSVKGRSDLRQLTIEVQQVDASQQVVRVDPVSLDVSGMDYDAKRLVTVQVPGGGDSVQAIAVLLENVPDEARRATWPEFQEP